LKQIIATFFLFFSLISLSQNKKIRILNADIQKTDKEKYSGATVLLGNVKVENDGIIITCDKAFYFKERNYLKAIQNVLINQGDTITQTSDYVDYDADSKQSVSWGNVVAKDPSITLTTDTLNLDRINQKFYYKTFGTIKDATNTLKSKVGNYFLETKKFTATVNVTVDNENHFLESNHLDYYTESGYTYLYGPSTVTNKENGNKIYCEKGFYNTKTDISHFVKNAKLFANERTIEGDSLYYDKNKGFASATNNIEVIDTLQNLVTRGNYAELFELKDSLFIVKRAVAISIVDKDSMFVHGDTIMITGKPEERIVRTFHDVKIFKSDLQGKCDSIHTDQSKGLTRMFKSPILWSDKNQITGDTIHLLSNTETEKLDSLKVLNNSFIISKDSIANDSIPNDNFNQIKGRNMFGKFYNNKLRTLLVKGNAESVYFNRNEETKKLETITKEISSNIEFTLEDGEIVSIKYMVQSDGKTYPPSTFPESDKKLKGFIWREEEQPKTKEDIFTKDNQKTPKKEDKEEPSEKTKAVLPKKAKVTNEKI
jgi:lipopolysaccharide export system protein LptA